MRAGVLRTGDSKGATGCTAGIAKLLSDDPKSTKAWARAPRTNVGSLLT
jgi:hypothetical protein